ncbi:MAG: hypothetical protein KGN33_18045 [Paracoccaceae bacterium]|nr:hypothetical protein [Paracoccaceae bacterium]
MQTEKNPIPTGEDLVARFFKMPLEGQSAISRAIDGFLKAEVTEAQSEAHSPAKAGMPTRGQILDAQNEVHRAYRFAELIRLANDSAEDEEEQAVAEAALMIEEILDRANALLRGEDA